IVYLTLLHHSRQFEDLQTQFNARVEECSDLSSKLKTRRSKNSRNTESIDHAKSKDINIYGEARSEVSVGEMQVQVLEANPSSKKKEMGSSSNCMSIVPKHTASSLRVASTCVMNKEVNKVQLKSPIMTHDNVNITTDKGKSICQKPSLETQRKWKLQIKTVKSHISRLSRSGSYPGSFLSLQDRDRRSDRDPKILL
ncbi:hypothetical protein Tco_1424555, partial [Tanacetum coccineum]